MPGGWIAPRNWRLCARRWQREGRAPRRCESVLPASRRNKSPTSLECLSKFRTTTRWSACSGGLRNTGNGRHASCCIAAGSRHSIEYWLAPRRSEYWGERHWRRSLWRTNCSITPKQPGRARRLRGATNRRYSESAAGIGEPALRRLQRSPPGRLRNRSSTCPVTPECWSWWHAISSPPTPCRPVSLSETRSGGIGGAIRPGLARAEYGRRSRWGALPENPYSRMGVPV
jgi:hypothetical protein